MKKYILEVETLVDIDCGETLSYYSKGHQDIQEFAEEVKNEYEKDIDINKVRHEYMRWEMFSGPDGPVLVGNRHYKPGRGIFPITVVDATNP
jgi:hypothetical protein